MAPDAEHSAVDSEATDGHGNGDAGRWEGGYDTVEAGPSCESSPVRGGGCGPAGEPQKKARKRKRLSKAQKAKQTQLEAQRKRKKGLTKPVILITTHFSPSNARHRQHSHAVSHSHSSSPFEEVATHVQYTCVFFEHQPLVAIYASSSGHSPFLEGSDVAGLRM